LLLTLALGGSLGGWAGLAFSATRTDNAALSPAATAPAPDIMALASIPAVPQPVIQRPVVRTRSSR